MDLARRTTVPALLVPGSESGRVSPVFVEQHEILRTLLPKAESFILPGATHALHMMNPRGMTEGLAAFFGKHLMSRDDLRPAGAKATFSRGSVPAG